MGIITSNTCRLARAVYQDPTANHIIYDPEDVRHKVLQHLITDEDWPLRFVDRELSQVLPACEDAKSIFEAAYWVFKYIGPDVRNTPAEIASIFKLLFGDNWGAHYLDIALVAWYGRRYIFDEVRTAEDDLDNRRGQGRGLLHKAHIINPEPDVFLTRDEPDLTTLLGYDPSQLNSLWQLEEGDVHTLVVRCMPGDFKTAEHGVDRSVKASRQGCLISLYPRFFSGHARLSDLDPSNTMINDFVQETSGGALTHETTHFGRAGNTIDLTLKPEHTQHLNPAMQLSFEVKVYGSLNCAILAKSTESDLTIHNACTYNQLFVRLWLTSLYPEWDFSDIHHPRLRQGSIPAWLLNTCFNAGRHSGYPGIETFPGYNVLKDPGAATFLG